MELLMKKFFKSLLNKIIKYLQFLISKFKKKHNEIYIVGDHPADYYYGVWIKHLVLGFANGYLKQIPETVVEVGPGAKPGTAIAALLSGVNKYYGLDIVEHKSKDHNIEIFNTLVELFRNKTGVKNSNGFPQYCEFLNSDGFPSNILTDEILKKSLDENRIKKIKNIITKKDLSNDDLIVKYIIPWDKKYSSVIKKADFLFSHSVMEHVDDIEHAYSIFFDILKNKGTMSHQIDFKSHGFSDIWNGYWCIGPDEWREICSNKTYTINRVPFSKHIHYIGESGFLKINFIVRKDNNIIKKDMLSTEYKNLTEADLSCSGIFIQSIKQI